MKKLSVLFKLAIVVAISSLSSCTSDEIPYSYSDEGSSDPTMRTVRLSAAGTLSQKISEEEKYTTEKLKVIGDINGTDFKLLRDMAGNNYRGDQTQGRLKVLDLSNARIVSGGERYLDADTLRYRYRNNEGIWDTNGKWSPNGGYRFSVDSLNQIPKYAFFGCNLQSIILPKTLVALQEYSLGYCTFLNSCTMQNSLGKIYWCAFYHCESLKSINIPASVKSISNSSFDYCVNLESIIVDSNNPNYDSRENCYAIINSKTNELIKGCKSSKVPSGVTSIGYDAFEGCEDLKSLVLPNTVTRINSYAFCGCKGLTSINIPESVETIGSGAFSNSGLRSVSIPKSILKIEGSTFSGCENLSSIEIPSSVQSIGQYAFYNSGIRSFSIPYGITKIEDSTFSNCKNLTSVEIPNTVDSIGEYAFNYCENLSSISIPSKVKKIERYTFHGCKSLSSIYIPSSVETIGNSAFSGCSEATSISFSSNSSLSEIGDYAFYDCDGITSIDVYSKKIGKYAFAYCDKLKSVYLENSVQSIGEYAFYSPNINNVRTYITNVFSIYENVFQNGVYKDASLYVPYSKKSTYQSYFAWSKFSHVYTY